MKITTSISDETLLAEAQRAADVATVGDVRRCFPGCVVVADDAGQIALTLEDVPVFGLALELVAGVAELARGGTQHSFNDLYGEFSVSMKREGKAVNVAEVYSGQGLAAPMDEWVNGVHGLVGDLGSIAQALRDRGSSTTGVDTTIARLRDLLTTAAG